MTPETPVTRVLLVDDEDEFRDAARNALQRRGFSVLTAASGQEALAMLPGATLDLIVLDLKMPGLSGIETLERVRQVRKALPVLILTGHGDFHDALQGIRLDIVDFVQKPVEMDSLAARIRKLLEMKTSLPIREPGIADLMVGPDHYPKLYADQPVSDAIRILWGVFTSPTDAVRVRSARVYDRSDRFIGLIRFSDLLRATLPAVLGNSPYSTYFTGMFLAQCKVIGNLRISEFFNDMDVSVTEEIPLMEAIHVMVENHLITLPVLRDGELVGILRETDIVGEMAGHFA
jgi:CheY-like chemotaxis protein